MARLIALPNKDEAIAGLGLGTPGRLLFKSDSPAERRAALAVTGAAQNAETGNITFPPEPFAVADLQLALPSLELDPATDDWMHRYVRYARQAVFIGNDELPLQDVRDPIGTDGLRLYPYQRVGSAWLSHVRRGILGDEMGLGKTVQALAATARCDRILIVTVPIAEHSVWETHVERWLGRACWVADGDGKRRQALLRQAAEQKRVVLVINHEMLQSRNMEKYPELWSVRWDAVILDEAHKVQGRPARKRTDGKVSGSQTSKGAEQLKADRMLLLTGTPVWNKPDSLYGLLRVLDPQRFSSYWRFVDEYCQTVTTEWATEVVGPKPEAMERLHNLLAPMLLRRTKDQVLKDLPAKTVQPMAYRLDGWLADAYWRLHDDYVHPVTGKAERSVPMAHADMRRLLNDPCLVGDTTHRGPKEEIILSLVEQSVGEGRPVVVFTWHNDYTTHLQTVLANAGYRVDCIYGGVKTSDRDCILRDFQAGKLQVLVASMATMSVAIDLTAARVAIFAEGHYVNTVVDQAESRLHRNGQKCDVTIYRLFARNTIEEAIWQTCDQRRTDADEMLCLEDVKARVQAQTRRQV